MKGQQNRALAKLLKPYGLRIEPGDHDKIVDKRGKVVYSMSHTPSCPYYAEHVVQNLAKAGVIPLHLKRTRLRS